MRTILSITLLLTFQASQAISLSKNITCTFYEGQGITSNDRSNTDNKTPLIWQFQGLESDNTTYSSDGDKGAIFSTPIVNGRLLFLPDTAGGHMFTINNSGQAYWSKHVSMSKKASYSLQYRGICLSL